MEHSPNDTLGYANTGKSLPAAVLAELMTHFLAMAKSTRAVRCRKRAPLYCMRLINSGRIPILLASAITED